ncbi:MAG: Lrp/AsnC family transcriptional regulator [bacterium]|nr:Lrp/AsnC family transcriptional regulator [bacterium]MDW8088083.1 Lrp/AsnC family transcriptional regulator [Candidatus Calescibacterium sp.]
MVVLNQEEIEVRRKKVLNIIQADFPFEWRPFKKIGEMLGLEENEVIDIVREYFERRIIRQICAIFDTRSLGYKSMLVAARTRKEIEDEAAKIINTHPGVSHNYRRNHDFNIWYTIAVPPNSKIGLERTVKILEKISGADEMIMLPTLKLYKIGVVLDMTGKEDIAEEEKYEYYTESNRKYSGVNEDEIPYILALQEDIFPEKEPFAHVVEKHSKSFDELKTYFHKFRQEGKIRRYAAILYHKKAGYKYNVMAVWKVEGTDEYINSIGEKFASYRGVSHCYRRPTYRNWPYSIFTMIHAHSKEEGDRIIQKMAEETGIKERAELVSTKEYKKVRLKYFTPDWEAWENSVLSQL